MKTNTLLLVSAIATIPVSAQAATLLQIDLGTANQITISATKGASSATVNGSDTAGAYLDGFFISSVGSMNETLVSGNLTSASNPTDNSPNLYRTGDPGLTIWSMSTDFFLDFTAGSQAFTGSATWSLHPVEFAYLLANQGSGDIYFAADSLAGLSSAILIGQWEVIAPSQVPVPAGFLLMGTALAGLGTLRARKKAS